MVIDLKTYYSIHLLEKKLLRKEAVPTQNIPNVENMKTDRIELEGKSKEKGNKLYKKP